MSRFAGWGWMLLAWLAAGPVLALAAVAVRGIPGVGSVEVPHIWAPAPMLLAAIVALLAAEFYFSWRESGRW